MTAVGMHRALPLRNAADHRKADIKNRQTQHQKRHGEGDHGIGLEQTENGDGSEHKAQEGGAGVAHKDRRRVEVIGNEADASADNGGKQDCRRHRRSVGNQDKRNNQHGTRRDCGDARCQSVQPVNKVDGVRNGDDPNHADGIR